MEREIYLEIIRDVVDRKKRMNSIPNNLPIELKYSATLRMPFKPVGVDGASEMPSKTTRYLC